MAFFEIPPKHAPITDHQEQLYNGEGCNLTWFQWFQRLRDNLDGGNFVAANLAGVNIALVTIQPSRFTRVGDSVMVSGAFQYQNVAAGILSAIELSIPIPSNFTGGFDVAGAGVSVDGGATEPARIFAPAVSRARLEWIAIIAGAPRSMLFTYGYRII